MMLKPLFWQSLSKAQKKTVLQRSQATLPQELTQQVLGLIKQVKKEGDKALFALTRQFDKVSLNTLAVSENEFEAAIDQMDAQLRQAFERVIAQLIAFHEKQRISNYAVETGAGIVCEQRVVPIQRVGLYVPAGSAPLVSTVLMLGVPSSLANCPLRILCTPPNQQGKIDPNILLAARLCGIEKIFKLGGAQAIAAMAYGTETIPKVDKIFGPGNAWVTLAKMLVSLDPEGAQLDLPAGPSEVMVLADDEANPEFVAADLLSQAEHGEDSQVVLVCQSEAFATAVNQALRLQLKTLARAKIATKALEIALCLIVKNPNEAISIANDYAPEHLILQLANPRFYLPFIYTAGSLFLGPYSPESVGDYASGTNHVLPTAGFARACSGLTLKDFTRTLTVQELSKEGLACLAETIRRLTDIEGLDAHQKAIDLRLGLAGVE